MNTTFTWLLSLCFLFFLPTEKVEASSLTKTTIENSTDLSLSAEYSKIDLLESPESISAASVHFRSKENANGNWNTPTNWQFSSNGIDWTDNTSGYPHQEALSVTIRNGTKISVNVDIQTRNIKIEAGGELIILNKEVQFQGSGIQLTVEKNGVLSFNNYRQITAKQVWIQTGGILRVNSIPIGNMDDFSAILTANPNGDVIKFQERAIVDWNCTCTLTPQINFFNVPGGTGTVILHLSKDFNYSSGGTTNIKALIEINENRNITFGGGGNKNFIGGVEGEGELKFNFPGSGIYRNGVVDNVINPILGSADKTLTINIPHEKIEIRNGAVIPQNANVIFKLTDPTSTFKRSKGIIHVHGTLDLGTYTVRNSDPGGVEVHSSGTVKTANTVGLVGSGATFSHQNVTLHPGSTIEYYNQTNTQNFTPNITYSNLKISGLANISNRQIEVNDVLFITQTGKLTLAETLSDEVAFNSITAKKGIQVEAGGELVVKNNSMIMQDEGAVNIGNIKLERRFSLSDERGQYNFVISPLIGQKIKSIYLGNPTVIKYNQKTNFFVSGGQGDYIVGKGYGIKEPKLSDTEEFYVDAVFSGVPFNGNATYALEYTVPSEIGAAQGFNLVGNPYPSNLDIISFYDDNKTKIESTVHFWDNRGHPIAAQQGSAYQGSNYATFNLVSGTGIGIGSGSDDEDFIDRVPTRYVRPGTGFIVQAQPSANGELLEFKNSHRIANNDSPEFFGKDGSKNTSRYWLTLKSPLGNKYMTAVVYFWRGNNAFGKDDSLPQFTSNEIYTFAEEQQVGINGRSVFEKDDVVQMGVRLFETGPYTISIYDQEGVFAKGQKIYLKDKDLNIIHNLSQSDYTFEGEAGEYNSRFELMYRLENAQLSENTLIADNSIQIDIIDKQIVAQSKESKIVKIEVYDLNSRPIYTNESVMANKFIIPSKQNSNQILFVKVETENGEIQTRKIILHP